MIQRGKGGKIINVTSLASSFGSGVFPSYAVTKGGLAQLTRSLAIELGPHNIQVNALAPGWVTTDMTEWIRTDPQYDWLLKEMVQRTPRGRFAEAEELKGAVVFLASSASDNMTGADFLIDGGFRFVKRVYRRSTRTSPQPADIETSPWPGRSAKMVRAPLRPLSSYLPRGAPATDPGSAGNMTWLRGRIVSGSRSQ